MGSKGRRILTVNSHEAWTHQLGYLGDTLHIVDGRPGRYCAAWDTNVRPVPDNATLLTLEEVAARAGSGDARYDCVIAHNVTDLLELKAVVGPRILVLHVTLEGRAHNEGTSEPPAGYARSVKQYLDEVGGVPIAVSALKAKSWSIGADVIGFAIDVDGYPAHEGGAAAGIRVANQISARRGILLWEFHARAFRDVPIHIVGFNPDLPGVAPSAGWDDLKAQLSRHRFFVHTADPRLEDGYNMATLEAMAAGLPILGNRHPTSLVEHGVSGFLSDDPDELGRCARRLLEEPELARAMGEAAKRRVREKMSVGRFVQSFGRCIESARRRWKKVHRS